jgi:restriction system protein
LQNFNSWNGERVNEGSLIVAIPDYQSLMLPVLKYLGDKHEHSIGEINEALANQLKLTPAQVEELLPSGRQRVFYSRIHWARTYLKNAGLLESIGRGRIRITQRGLDVLKDRPSRIDDKFLDRFPEFQEFQRIKRKDRSESKLEQAKSQTPEELMESGYQTLRATLSQELLGRIKKAPPKFFEQLVVDLLLAMGYGGSRKDAGQAVGQSGDEGIDGIIKEDKLGLDAVYIQAKRWDGPVGRPIVQGFVGSLEGYRATKGILITTSKFAQSAVDYANSVGKKIVLIDGEQLAQFMIDHDVGVTEMVAYVIKRVDLDYFGEE